MAEFSVGGVLGDTVERTTTGFVPHFIYALIPALAYGLVSYLANRTMIGSSVGQSGTEALKLFASPWYWISLVLSLLVPAWTTTGIIGSMIARPDGALSFGEMTAISIPNLLKYIVLLIVWYVMVAVGFMLLIIPGLIVLAMFCAAVPAMLDKHLGPWEALKDSRRLTKGRRLKVLACLVIFALIISIPSFAFLGAVGFGSFSAQEVVQQRPLMTTLYSVVLMPLFGVIVSAFMVALYDGLGGSAGARLAEAFI
jgi:hypothetical protein